LLLSARWGTAGKEVLKGCGDSAAYPSSAPVPVTIGLSKEMVLSPDTGIAGKLELASAADVPPAAPDVLDCVKGHWKEGHWIGGRWTLVENQSAKRPTPMIIPIPAASSRT
jgi:hypothetical protein